MRYRLLIILFISLSACDTPKHARIKGFWEDFQKFVATNNRTAIADMTIFPLKGTEFIGGTFNENGLSREQFLQHYEQLFDEKTRQIIASTPVNKLVKFISQKDTSLSKIGIPPSAEIYNLTVSYTFDEGLETQTESSVAFYFVKRDDIFKLAFLLIAG